MDQETESILAKFGGNIPVSHSSRPSISTSAQLISEPHHHSRLSSEVSEPSPGSILDSTMDTYQSEGSRGQQAANSDSLFGGGDGGGQEIAVGLPPTTFFDGWTSNGINPPGVGQQEDFPGIESTLLDWQFLTSEVGLEIDSGFGRSPDTFGALGLDSAPVGQPPLFPDASGFARSESTLGDVDDIEGLVDQLSDRVGALRIGPHGQTRFYGPTSNFNLVDMPADDTSTVHRTIRDDGYETLERLGIGQQVPAELEQHLTKLYFTWQDPSLHVVDRAMYEKARAMWVEKGEDSSYFSESLQNVM